MSTVYCMTCMAVGYLVNWWLLLSVHSILLSEQLTLSFELEVSMKFSYLQVRKYTRQLQQALRHVLKLDSLLSEQC